MQLAIAWYTAAASFQAAAYNGVHKLETCALHIRHDQFISAPKRLASSSSSMQEQDLASLPVYMLPDKAGCQ